MLVYRSSRFLNLAHGQLGALPALLLAKFVIDRNVPYWVALPLCVAIGTGTGIIVDRFLVRRLRSRTSSGVTALLFTVGVSQLLLFFMLVPAFQPDNVELGRHGYPLPFHGSFTVDKVVFGGQHIAILLFCPIVVLGLGAFLRWTIFGKMVRAVASNEDAARLCGISPRFVSALTWGIAGGLSTFSAVLAAPSATTGAAGAGSFGSTQLLLALGAATFGSFVSIPWTVAGGVILGMVNQFTLYETANAGTAQLVVFLLILGVVFARGRSIAAVFSGGGVQVEDRPPFRIPAGARDLLLARRRRPLLIGTGLLLGVVAPFLPALHTEGARFQLCVILIFGIVGISMTLLVGWGGQLSLGHLAVVGVGAFVGARLADQGRSLVLLLVLTGLLGAAVLVVIGLPALRVRGLALAVTTLGFAVVSVQWLFHASWFTGSDTGFVNLDGVIPPLNGIEPTGMLSAYWTTLAVLVGVALVAGRVRRSTFGHRIIAVRDDERAAAAYGITPLTTKLGVLAVSGAIAGMAGTLWANAWQSVSATQFSPELSLTVLAVPVVGGLGSIAGAIAGAVLIYFPTFFWSTYLHDLLGDSAQSAFQLLFGGLNVLVVLLVFPAGLAGVGQRLWERVLARLATGADDDLRPPVAVAAPRTTPPALVVQDIEVRFGGILALDGATIEVAAGEIVGLIGPNGAGKSTLIDVLSGVRSPEAGSVHLHGDDITHDAPDARAALGLGRSFQAATLFPGLTVRELVEARLASADHDGDGALAQIAGFPWARRAGLARREAADEVLARMGLTAWADELTTTLSTGTRRICDLAVQVAGHPSVLLLDEPTGGVAQREAEEFGPLLRRLRDELDCAIVIVEHDLPLLLGLCDRVYAMLEGRVVAEGTPEEVRRDPLVIASYLGTDERAIQRSGGPRRKLAASTGKGST